MLFTELLKEKNLTEETVSHGIKGKIKRYNRVLKAVDEAKEKLKTTTKDSIKKTLETEIATGEETLSKWNEEICTAVTNFSDNAELNKKKAENLKKAREAAAESRKNKTEGGADGEEKNKKPAKVVPADLTVASVAQSIIDNGGKVVGKDVIAFYKENEQAVKDEIAKITAGSQGNGEDGSGNKKKNNAGTIVGIVLGSIAVAAAAIFGINYYNKNK